MKEEPNARDSAQERRLVSLQFAWSVDVQAARWHHLFHEARRFKARARAAAPARPRPRHRRSPAWHPAGMQAERAAARLASCTACAARAARVCVVGRRTCSAPLPPAHVNTARSGLGRFCGRRRRALQYMRPSCKPGPDV